MNKLNIIALNIIRSLATPIFNFLITIIGVMALGKYRWGDFVQIILWIYLFVFISNFGNRDFLIRSFSKSPSKIDSLFFTNLSSRSILLVLSLVFLIIFPLKTALLSVLLGLSIFLYQSLESLVIYFQKFIVQIVAESVGLLIIVGSILFYNNLDTNLLLLIYCISFWIKTFLILYDLNLNYKAFKFHFSYAQIKESLPFFLIGFSGWLASKADIYMVNIMLTKEQLTEYQLLMTAILFLQGIAAYIIYPFTKHMYRLPLKFFNRAKRILGLVSVPIIVLFTVITWFVYEEIIELNIPQSHYILGALLSLPYYFFLIDIIALYKINKEISVMYVNFGSAIVNIVLTLLLIPIFEVMGALVSVLVIQYSKLFLYKSKLIR
ncbi:hypothetical protein ACFO5O_03080 [Geojedonia litorea]|uniref:Polysaccharide biosynthesis protein C-terminal domain-containing protein n=1 Tax=Geojedonia litorea TaxID=1268269 RepID=A0ABV9MZ29_9FLAO